MSSALQVAIGDTWHPKLLSYFGMALMALMLISNVLNLKFIDVFGMSVIGSQIIYSFSLILTDVMTEVYGYRRVRKLLYVGLAFLIVYAVSLEIAVLLPPAKDYANNEAFRTMFSQSPRIALASIVGYFTGELVNSFVMSRLKILTRARYFYGRATAAVAIAQLIDGFIFFGVAFLGVMPLRLVASATLSGWLMVMFCEIVVLPLTKQIAQAVKRYEGIEHYDEAPSESAVTVSA